MLSKMMKKFHNKKGFTMIELIAVMAVIAVLITILLPQVSALRERSVKTEATKVAKEVFQAIQAYDLENGTNPTSIDELKKGGYVATTGRTEKIGTITANDLSFKYYLKKQGYNVTVTYSGANQKFTIESKKTDDPLPTAEVLN